MRITNKFIDENHFVYSINAKKIILAQDKDKNAPPESYFAISCRKDDLDIYIDTYWVDINKNLVISFAYRYEDSWNIDENRWTYLLYDFLKSHNLPRQPLMLKGRIYPRERFKRLLKEYYC